jgi:hypothetical protein
MAFAPQAENMAPDVVREASTMALISRSRGNSRTVNVVSAGLGAFFFLGSLSATGSRAATLSPNTSQCFVASACTAMTLSSSAALESVSAAVALPSAVRRSCGLSYSERQSKGTRPIVASPLRLASRLKAASKGPPFCRLSRSQFL